MPILRELSKKDWAGNSNNQDINSGSLQRIADATEMMAKSYNNLIKDRDYYKGCYEAEIKSVQRLLRSNAALRGHFRRLKGEK